MKPDVPHLALCFTGASPELSWTLKQKATTLQQTALYDSCFISEQLQGIYFDSVKKCHSQSQDTRVIYNILNIICLKTLQINMKHTEQITVLKCSVHLLDYFLSFNVRVSSI